MAASTETTPKRLVKAIYLLKRYTDAWNESSVHCLQKPGFNAAYIPLFMSIGMNISSNNDLARTLNITKQAASKIIKELEAINLVQSEKNADDARAVNLKLTPEGEDFYQHLKGRFADLEAHYKQLVGAKNYEIAIDVMEKLIAYHKEHC